MEFHPEAWESIEFHRNHHEAWESIELHRNPSRSMESLRIMGQLKVLRGEKAGQGIETQMPSDRIRPASLLQVQLD